MKKKKILFVCKYNRFRSRTAEAYFKKINKNKNIIASSAGVIQGFLPLDKTQVKVAKSYGINILGKPRTMTMDLLKDQDKIIVVANDVPKEVFSYSWYKNKVIIWKIPDVITGKSVKQNKRIIKAIMKKVEELNERLKKRKWNL